MKSTLAWLQSNTNVQVCALMKHHGPCARAEGCRPSPQIDAHAQSGGQCDGLIFATMVISLSPHMSGELFSGDEMTTNDRADPLYGKNPHSKECVFRLGLGVFVSR